MNRTQGAFTLQVHMTYVQKVNDRVCISLGVMHAKLGQSLEAGCQSTEALPLLQLQKIIKLYSSAFLECFKFCLWCRLSADRLLLPDYAGNPMTAAPQEHGR